MGPRGSPARGRACSAGLRGQAPSGHPPPAWVGGEGSRRAGMGLPGGAGEVGSGSGACDGVQSADPEAASGLGQTWVPRTLDRKTQAVPGPRC